MVLICIETFDGRNLEVVEVIRKKLNDKGNVQVKLGVLGDNRNQWEGCVTTVLWKGRRHKALKEID